MGGCLFSTRNETTADADENLGAKKNPSKQVRLEDKSSVVGQGTMTNLHGHKTGGLKPSATTTSHNNLTKFILKFPLINKAYTELYGAFCNQAGVTIGSDETAKELFGKRCPNSKLQPALADCGCVISAADLAKALKIEESDLSSESTTTTFKNFLLAVGTVYNPTPAETISEEKETDSSPKTSVITRSENETLGKKHDKIHKGFKVVADMFGAIDTDGSGEITLDEMQQNFAGLGLGDQGIYETRMKEMDFNNDKEIEYAEFCVGISVWVGFVDEIGPCSLEDGPAVD